jgi:signal transduction histidine kinase
VVGDVIPMKRQKWTWWLPTTFAIVVLSFLVATALGQWKMHGLDRAALEIAEIAAPSIEHLAAARGDIRHLQVAGEDQLDAAEHRDNVDAGALQHAHATLDRRLDAYLVLPVWAGEQPLQGDILRSRDTLAQAVSRLDSQLSHRDLAAARATLRGELADAATDLSAAMMSVVELKAARAHDLALEIRRERIGAAYAAFGLDLVCSVIAVASALSLYRLMRARASLAERHRHLDEERALELEQFAGRVAHDILSPLNAVSFAMQLAGHPADEEQRARVVERGLAALQRVKQLVNGLLDFARAGASPDRSSRADVQATLKGLAVEFRDVAAEAGIDLRFDEASTPYVQCHPGVLMSLIGNLVRNAIKYLGESPTRIIDVRAIDRGDMVRIEVEDTGPGLAPDIKHRVFEVYARGRGSTQPGIGLGLATVKRLAESHGGRAGVRSILGRGCTFWFELPRAQEAPSLADAEVVPG